VTPNVMMRLLAMKAGRPWLDDEIFSDMQAGLRQQYRVLCADPPWFFGDGLPGPGRGAAKHYDLMTTEEICEYQLPVLADDAYLFMWRVSAMVEEAYRVVRAWGFEPKTEVVWRKKTVKGKRHFGMGWHLRAEHEACIVAVRGSPKPLVRNIRTVFDAPASRKHSAKPETFYTDVVEKLSKGPYVELFARSHRDGWTCLGKELE
jgi:N6-adenosine-specific RNA methylase IME4